MTATSHPSITQLARALAPAPAGDTRAARTPDGPRVAAVALLLRPTAPGDDLELLLIRRAERAGDIWSGHMALPGGRAEPSDPSTVHTAARETREEVGIDLDALGATLLGALPLLEPRNPRLPSIVVHPFVWSLPPGDVVLDLQPSEVAAAQWVTISHLRAAEHATEYALTIDDVVHALPAITLGEHVLWGMTHRIVETLLDTLDGTS